MSSSRLFSLALAIVAGGTFQTAFALTVPYTEDFPSNDANWRDVSGVAGTATWVSAGGPDGSSYVTATANGFGGEEGDSVIAFRGHSSYGTSDGAFVGNWLDNGANRFTAWVKHDAPEPLDFFVRFATVSNHPATAADKGILVAPNTWTQLSYDIDPANIFNATTNPTGYLITEGPASFFDSTFKGLANIQIGYSVPNDAFGLVNQAYTFSLDQPSISNVPEPASWLLGLSLAMAGILRRGSRKAK